MLEKKDIIKSADIIADWLTSQDKLFKVSTSSAGNYIVANGLTLRGNAGNTYWNTPIAKIEDTSVFRISPLFLKYENPLSMFDPDFFYKLSSFLIDTKNRLIKISEDRYAKENR